MAGTFPGQAPLAGSAAGGQVVDKSEWEETGPATLAEVMAELDRQIAEGNSARFRPLATGFRPLDDVLNGGLRPGELMIVGGAFGVGKTIFGLQVARNVVFHNPDSVAMFICYEHDRIHLMSRLVCLESAEQDSGGGALTLRKLAELVANSTNGNGLTSQLRSTPRYARVLKTMNGYADRLALVKASGNTSTLDQIGEWSATLAAAGRSGLLVVDYLQKIPVDRRELQMEEEVTTYLTQGLKELAMTTGLRIVAIAASDRIGLKSPRMRLADLRGSSALQYEADIGLILNNKHAIVSREHMIYNLSQAEAMRNWVVMSVEKNRAGRTAVDMEYQQDPAHFRLVPDGDYVRDRLVDERVTLA